MINIPLIGVATALVLCALIAKALAREPKKASKSQKGEILKQLLELSEHENRVSATTAPVRTSRPNQSARSGNTSRMKQQPTLGPIRANNRLNPASGGNSSMPR
jgi:hypothetical protein